MIVWLVELSPCVSLRPLARPPLQRVEATRSMQLRSKKAGGAADAFPGPMPILLIRRSLFQKQCGRHPALFLHKDVERPARGAEIH
jgi:hypothetical protein